MDQGPSARLSRLIETRREQLAQLRSQHPGRAQRDHLIAAVAAFLAELTAAVGEINDALCETDIVLALAEHDRQYAAEWRFRVLARDQDSDDAFLDVVVDPAGRVHAFIGRHGRRDGVAETALAEVTRAMLIDWLVRLLEARYLG